MLGLLRLPHLLRSEPRQWLQIGHVLRHQFLRSLAFPHPDTRKGLQPSVAKAHTSQAPSVMGTEAKSLATRVAVVAFGGNALLSRGEALTMEAQWENATKAADSVARLVNEEGMMVCVTHGNGPQVGLLALQDPGKGLDVLDAESEGQIGYILETQLANALPSRDVVTLLTQTVVDPTDPAFGCPTKPIGPCYDKEEADRLAAEKGWRMMPDGQHFRRVVASPDPKSIVEARAIQLLLANNVVAICCGGGGIPVAIDEAQHRRFGVEAVVDKDLASAVLAVKIGADWLLMLTDCDAVYDPRQWPDKKVPLQSPITVRQLAGLQFASGSMGPKVQAACRFVEATGGSVGIGRLADAVEVMRGTKGTIIKADS